LSDLLVAAAELKLTVLRLRMVHGTPEAEAKVFLVELAKGRRHGALQVLPPLIVRSDGQNYTAEVRKILLGT
ncbi:MAG: SAM-dependent methyltransferase, partial [Geobacter sp.]